MYNIEHVSVVEGSSKGCETKRKGRFEFPDSILPGCNTVSNGKSDLPEKNYNIAIFMVKQCKEYDFFYKHWFTLFELINT